MKETYNGWTNYETWRVNLEIFDGDPDAYRGDDLLQCADELKQTVEDIIESDTANGIGRSYAMAFISDVNWVEIARNLVGDE